MGRKKLYLTESQQIQARKERQLRFYYKHKKRLNQERLERYHKSK